MSSSAVDMRWCVAVMVQIRNVPEDLHRKLKAGRACWHVDLGIPPPGIEKSLARARKSVIVVDTSTVLEILLQTEAGPSPLLTKKGVGNPRSPPTRFCNEIS